MRRISAVAVLLCLVVSIPSTAQTTNATVGGTVVDTTRAFIPGVTVTATNARTGVSTVALTNETGTYNFASLQPGMYRITAELPGFQTQNYDNVELGASQQLRLNFTLAVGTVATAVEVTVEVDSLIATSSASVGQVLTESKVRDLPLVGRDALNLINTLAGIQQGTGGPGGEGQYGVARATATFAGMYARAGVVDTVRDGISVSDNRYEVGIHSTTRINPDLVGELRVIVAPVDAETGGGVGQVQVLTRSGTNRYQGSAVWNVQNSALNANTWNENRIGAEPTWFNRQQLTFSFGGPIVRNKTFFFALFDGQRMNSRANVTTTVLTDTARQGLFRYFPGVVNGNAEANITFGNNPTAPVVDLAGNPVRPAAATGELQTISVFGRDQFRPGFDSTGFIHRFLEHMPRANDFRGGDGLNTAQHRWVRRGDTLIGGQFGTEDDTNRNQLNVKVDHHFNASHKLTASYVHESQWNRTWMSNWPTGWEARVDRSPRVLTTSFVSTLSPNLVNEFRFGYRTLTNDTPHSCQRPETRDEVAAWLPSVNGYMVRVSPTSFGSHRIDAGCNATAADGPTITYADSLSWTRGKHAFKGGVEVRLSRSGALSSVNWVPHAAGGAGNIPVTGIETSTLPGMIGGNLTAARNLLLTLSGSLSSVQQAFRMDSPTATEFKDINDLGPRPPWRSLIQNEVSGFFKDDWKVFPSLTLNLGVRYSFYGVPYERDGFTATLVGGGMAGFGWTGRNFEDYWSFGPQKGALSEVHFIGPNSPNPDVMLWRNDLNNFAPAVGFSWSLPWFGRDQTTIRGGYGVSYVGTVGRAMAIDGFIGHSMPGTSDNQTFTSPGYLSLANMQVPVPKSRPLEPVPLTQRTQSVTVFDTDGIVNPYIQTFNLQVTRTLRRSMTLDLRYVGTKGTKLFGTIPLNQRNYLTNGLLEALEVTRAGGNAPLLDQMLMGINIPGAGLVNGTTLTGSAALRQSTTFRGNIANGNFTNVANSLNSSTITGEAGGLLRRNGLPENFITNNPQFNNVTMFTNPGSSIYHSLQTQVTLRPNAGLSYQLSHTWSKAISGCGNAGCTSWVNALDRRLNRSLQDSDRTHVFQLNGAYELPFGPNRHLLGASSGLLARLVEKWQLSWIFSANTGAALSIASGNTYVESSRPDIAGPFPQQQGDAQMTDALPRYFDLDMYRSVSDPQCAGVTALNGTRTACTLQAITDADGRIILQHSQPGTLGNLGHNWLRGPGRFGFDMSAAKTVDIDETRSMQFRVDAQNVLNRPILGNPTLNMNSANFGQIPATQVFGSRQFQAQLRVNF